LLKDIDIRDYGTKNEELFIVFECLDEGESFYETDEGVIYLIVRIPFEEMDKTTHPFQLQVDYFFQALPLLSELLDVERLAEDCQENLQENAASG